MANDPAKQLINRWIHSHEEDTPGELVFRPAGFNFPRSRGRTGFELRPDRSMVEIQPGAADAGEESRGKWELQGKDRLAFFKPGKKEPSRILRIVSADSDRLVAAEG
ncbi:MAG TPA: hypothetical protein VM940_12895 [Chthoniobacterales bacterium]|jgi:hypothetical protein|nr:hypothetical protein [Chthoniobacterales bacterium]